MYRRPIGFVDSGIGGLSIWDSVTKLLPSESTLYLGDHAYLPYGNLSVQEIRRRIIAIIHWFIQSECKAIILACNTATVAGIDYYRKTYPDIPIIGVVPVVKTAANNTKSGHIAVMATTFTANSSYQKILIKTFAQNAHITLLPCVSLVPLIEDGHIHDALMQHELQRILKPMYGSNIDVIVLGCTHYSLMKDLIQSYVGDKVKLFDSTGAVARQTKRILEHNHSLIEEGKGLHTFFTTGSSRRVSHIASNIMERPLVFKKVLVH